MRILGIDPGAVSGAWALLSPGVPPFGSNSMCGDLSSVDGEFNPADFAALVVRLQPDVAMVERVSAMPKQGVSSTFKFGRAYGGILGVLAGAGVPVHLVTPMTWKKAVGLRGPDKERSRELAIRLYPANAKDLSRKKDAGRAEALLIARCLQLRTGD